MSIPETGSPVPEEPARPARGRWRRARRAIAVTVLLAVLLFPVINIVPPVWFHPPLSNTDQDHFDVVIVLGFPAHSDGTPSDVMRDRVKKAVELFRAGRADHLLLSGGAAHNQYAEADVMAGLAETLGMSAERITRETASVNSYQNMLLSVELMQKHGWKSALIVTSPGHVPRAAFIASHYPILYRTVGTAQSADVPWYMRVVISQYERLQQTRFVLFGLSRDAGLSEAQARLAERLQAQPTPRPEGTGVSAGAAPEAGRF